MVLTGTTSHSLTLLPIGHMEKVETTYISQDLHVFEYKIVIKYFFNLSSHQENSKLLIFYLICLNPLNLKLSKIREEHCVLTGVGNSYYNSPP